MRYEHRDLFASVTIEIGFPWIHIRMNKFDRNRARVISVAGECTWAVNLYQVPHTFFDNWTTDIVACIDYKASVLTKI